MFNDIRYIIKKTPLIGGLVECSGKDHLNAVIEFITTIFFSFLPITVAFVVDHYTKKDITFMMSFFNNIHSGELFIYSTSILAPVFYTVMNEKGERRTFPSRSISIFIYGAIMFLAAIVFALQRANVILDGENIFQDSIYLLFISFALLYLVIVYNNYRTRLNPAEEMQNQENDFTVRLQEHRG